MPVLGNSLWDVYSLLEKLLEHCRGLGLLQERGKQRTDATRVLAAIRVMSRLELVTETVRAALNELATLAQTGYMVSLQRNGSSATVAESKMTVCLLAKKSGLPAPKRLEKMGLHSSICSRDLRHHRNSTSYHV